MSPCVEFRRKRQKSKMVANGNFEKKKIFN